MIAQGVYTNFAIDRVIYGKPAAAVLAGEAARLGAKRVFLLVSRTLDRETTWVSDMRSALGDRYAGFHDGMPSHTPRQAVLDAAEKARSVGTDLVVTFGGGSGTDAGKMIRLALKHDIRTVEAFDPFKTISFEPAKLGITDPDGLSATAAVAVGLALRRTGDR